MTVTDTNISAPDAWILDLVELGLHQGASRLDFGVDPDNLQLSFGGTPFTFADFEAWRDLLSGQGLADGASESCRRLAQVLRALQQLPLYQIFVESGDGTSAAKLIYRPQAPGYTGPSVQLDYTLAEGTLIHIAYPPGPPVHPYFREHRFDVDVLLLRERAAYGEADVRLGEERLTHGLLVPDGIDPVAIEPAAGDGEWSGVGAYVASTRVPAELRVVSRGVWRVSLPGPPARPGFVGVLRADDPDYARLDDETAGPFADAADRALIRLCERLAEKPKRPGYDLAWGVPLLKSTLRTFTERAGAVGAVAPGSDVTPLGAALAAAPLWQTSALMGDAPRRIPLADVMARTAAGSVLRYVVQPFLHEPGEHPELDRELAGALVLHLPDEADRDYLEAVTGARLEGLDERVQRLMEEAAGEVDSPEGAKGRRLMLVTFVLILAASVYLVYALSVERGRRPNVGKRSSPRQLSERIKLRRRALAFYQGDAAGDLQRAAVFFRRGCDKGDGPSCAHLAWMHQSGEGVARDAQLGQRFLERACTADDGRSCRALGVRRARGVGGPRDIVQAAKLFLQGCEDQNGPACAFLADAYAVGRGLPRNASEALRYHRRACRLGVEYSCRKVKREPDAGAAEVMDLLQHCDLGEADACRQTGRHYVRGQYLRHQRYEAPPLLRRACAAGDATGCGELAECYVYGHGIDPSVDRAVTFYGRGCDGGYARSCHELAELYASGHGVATDKARAAKLYHRGCDKHHAASCVAVARLYKRGDGVTPNEPAALRALGQACVAGRVDLCFKLGVLYAGGRPAGARLGLVAESGAPIDREPARAAKLFGRSCRGGRSDGCIRLGDMHDAGTLGEPKPAEAARLYRKACRSRAPEACVKLADLHFTGRGVTKRDPERGTALLAQACEGMPEACAQLADLFGRGQRGVKRDIKRAGGLYARACNGGVGASCFELAKLFRRGIGGKREEAQLLYQLACDHGFKPACKRVKKPPKRLVKRGGTPI